jgi:zinc protease
MEERVPGSLCMACGSAKQMSREDREGYGMKRILRLAAAAAMFVLCFLPAPLGLAGSADVLRSTLDNGLQVVIVRNELAPVVTTMVNYLVGSNEAPDGFPGMAHAQEHMMFRGSPGLSGPQLATLIAAMGGRFNADTQQTVTQYFFTVPSEDLETALHIEAIRMRDVLNSQELWQRERGAIEQEVAQDYSNPLYLFHKRMLSSLFEGTVYAHDALGTKPSFEQTTGAMLKEFHAKWYAPNNAIVVIVGDIEPQETLRLVKGLFESIPSRPVPLRPEIRLEPLKPDSIMLESDLPYGIAMVAYRLPGYESPDFAAAQVLADILDSQRGNLYALVPEGKALEAGFESSFLPRAGYGYATAAFPHGGDGNGLLRELKAVIERYREQGFPSDLVEAAKRREVADLEFQKNSVEGLASLWSQALAVEGRHSPEEDIEAIKAASVADVNRVARTYLDNHTATTGVLSPRPAGKAVASRTFHGKESFAPAEAKEVALPEWAERALQPVSLPQSSITPTETLLPNGLHLIVRPTKVSRTIGLYGQVKSNSDLQTPKGQEGVADLLDGLFSYGTTSLDRLAFQKAVDDIAANLSAGSTFSLEVLEDQFDRGVSLLADNVLHPALPEEAFKVVQKETMDLVAGKLKSASYLARRALRTGLYPKKDPTLREATPATLSSLTLENVRKYHQAVFRPDLTTIVLIGDISPDQGRTVVEKYFGEWKALGPKPDTDFPSVPLNKASVASVPDKSRVQDLVLLAQTLGLNRSHPDYYLLQLGNHVLSGAFYATRLYHDLREQAGLVYTVESLLDVGRTRGLFEVVFACDPPNLKKARNMIEKNLTKMQATPVTSYELRQAKTLLLQSIPLSQSSTEGIARMFLDLSMKGLPLDEQALAAKRYMESTAEEVQAAFSKWIRPRNFVQISLGPKPN